MSHPNFSFLMIIVIWVVYLVPLVDSWIISHKRIMKLPVGLIWLFWWLWFHLKTLMSYAICLRFNNSNLDTKCTFLAVCRAALQIFGSNSPSAENEGQPVYVQWNCRDMMYGPEIRGREPHRFLESNTDNVVWLTKD